MGTSNTLEELGILYEILVNFILALVPHVLHVGEYVYVEKPLILYTLDKKSFIFHDCSYA